MSGGFFVFEIIYAIEKFILNIKMIRKYILKIKCIAE